MKYLYTREELITEKIEFKKWRNYVLGIGVAFAILTYKLDQAKGEADKKQTELDIRYNNLMNIINDINNTPTESEKIYLDQVKSEIIEEIKSSNKINRIDKEKVLKEIQNIRIIITSHKNINSVTDRGSNACYLRYVDTDETEKKIILVSRDRLNTNSVFVSHEIYHLVDNILGDKKSYYSEISQIVDILDKDIITKTPAGIKKVEDKINFFIKNTKKNTKKSDTIPNTIKTSKAKSKITEEEILKLRTEIVTSLKNLIYASKDYMIEPSEVYVRYHGMKRWLLKNGYIKSVNDTITKKIIIDLFSTDLLENLGNDEIDYFELLFFLNIDPTNEAESQDESETLKKMNSIATNYSDYVKNNIV